MPGQAVASLLLEVQRTGEIVVVKCGGKLIAGTGGQLYAKVCPLIAGSKRVLLDLTGVTHMDSLGLGTIVRLYVSAKSAGSCLELINFGQRIRQLLGITNLLSVLTTMCEQGVTLRF